MESKSGRFVGRKVDICEAIQTGIPNPTPGATSTHAASSPTILSSFPPGPVNKTWYFAEGRIGKGFKEYLTLGNPSSYVTLVNGYGRTYTLAFNASVNSRTTVDMNGLVIAHLLQSGDNSHGYEVSVTVQTLNGAPLVAERPLYWNASGTQGGSVTLGSIGG